MLLLFTRGIYFSLVGIQNKALTFRGILTFLRVKAGKPPGQK